MIDKFHPKIPHPSQPIPRSDRRKRAQASILTPMHARIALPCLYALACLYFATAASSTHAGDLLGAAGKAPVEAIETIEITPRTTFAFGLGYLDLHADEIVYGGPGNNNELSHLIWDSEGVLIVDLGLSYDITKRLSIFAEGVIGLDDNSHMVDYDYLGDNTSWTDRSLHPRTKLKHYYQADLGFDFTVIKKPTFQLDFRLGARYTEAAWDAYGGSYVYSSDPKSGAIRDDVGNFPDHEIGISYRQRLPGVYLGPKIEWAVFERLSVRAGGLVGVTYAKEDRDRHWARDLVFEVDLESRPFYGGMLEFEYALTRNMQLYVEGNYDYYSLAKGPTTISNTVTGEVYRIGGDSAGAALEAWQVKAGVKLHF